MQHDEAQTAPTGAERRAANTDRATAKLVGLWDQATSGHHWQGVALAAVGSLGRGELGPRSDLDLVLIHDGRSASASQITDLAQRLWYPLWDEGIDLDHSVRTLAQCRQVAAGDLPAAIGLLDLRAIAGDLSIVHRAATGALADWRKAARRRLPELLEANRARAAKFGELAYLLEPDLKEARGGLRDAVVLQALAATWLTDRPHGAVDHAITTLLDARDAIQVVTGRRTHRLLSADADDVATAMGFADRDDLLAALAEAGRQVSYALDTTARRARQAMQRPAAWGRPFLVRGQRTPPRLKAVAEGLVVHDGELVLSADARTTTDPVLPLRAAAAAVQHGLGLSPVTVESLSACPPLPHPWPHAARDHLITLLGSGHAQVAVWEALDLAGIVTTWMPQWAAIRNRPQRAAAHRHTVDRHSVEVAALAALLRGPDDDAEVIGLAALLHDIGKRAGAIDHSEEGALLVPEIVRPMGFPEATIADVTTLVRHHLLLSRLALNADPDDPATARELADAMGWRSDLIDALRILTEADSTSLGKHGWSQWRATLLDDLVGRAKELLRTGPGAIG